MSYDKLTNLDSREGFVGFDSINEFDNPVVRDEYHNWLDSHYNEVDEDLLPNDDDFDDDYDDVNYIDQDDVDEYTEWQDYMGGDDSPYDNDSDCENEW